MYVKLNLFLQRGFESKYGLALFEVLSDYRRIGKLQLEIDVVKTLLGVGLYKYSVFAMFRKKVLDRAISEVNNLTPLQISYEVEKIGRKYSLITFFITGEMNNPSKEKVKGQILEKLKFYGFHEKQINFLINTHDADYLLANI